MINNKRTKSARRFSQHYKELRTSFYMVADSVQSSNTKLENNLKIMFPVNRLDSLSAENQFMVKAAIEECQQYILGTYVEKPMFPLIEVPQLGWKIVS